MNKFIADETTNDSGFATFANAAYDYYTVRFEGDSLYLPSQ